MYASATVYWATIIYNTFTASARLDSSDQVPVNPGVVDMSSSDSEAIQDCVGMSTLFTNVSTCIILRESAHHLGADNSRRRHYLVACVGVVAV